MLVDQNVPSNLLRSLFFKTLGLFSASVLLLCAWYFTVGINVWTSWATVILIGGLVCLSIGPIGRIGLIRPSLSDLFPRTTHGILLSALATFSFVLILLICFGVRTGEAVISPWNILPPWIFLPYGIGLLCTMLVGHFEKNDSALPLGMLFTFVSTSVAPIVYAQGFGFDPFLHRAAETALVHDGFIKPLQLLYSGQYALVAALHYITFLPIKWIDIWLLPILASWFLPLGAAIGLREGWGLSDTEARTWWPVILVIPFSLITFTVPFTLTFLFFLLFCFLWPMLREHLPIYGEEGRGHRWVLLLSFLAAIFFHPLLAIPMLIFGLGIWVKRFRFITPVVLALSVPAMLFVSHAAPGIPHLSSLIEHRELFFNLFRSPYWDPYPFIPWTLQALYGFRYWLPMVLFAGGLLALTLPSFKRMRVDGWIFAGGLLLTIWGTSTLFSFRDIIVHEQAEFALRLLQAAFTFPLPIFAVIIAGLVRRFKWMLVPMITIVASCVTISWFFSYPQFNLKYPFFSPSVSNDDVAAVHEIDTRSNGEPYVVLVHQMTSAAAIQEFGFSQIIQLDGADILRYPIPTGGTLYPYYEDLLYNGVTREKFDALQRKTRVKHIYFVTHDYWAWSADMLQSLAANADAQIREPSLTIWAFDYVAP